ncbi:hypothetical protein ZEAMMB73_Zm00001d030154 [Zea mays]|uniref:Uncharacterized protein n=1 Tax=Zea mays TaxID=4577 RepID=A0A1D6KAA1_MAIZE|nr:hypothetical protein ZEAMMB73_Zm00001d030154 [Zea mays]
MAPAFPRRRPTSPDSPPHTAAAPMAHPPCSPPWPPGGGFGLPESPPNVSPPNQSEKSTGRSFCTSRTGEGRGARQHYVPAGRVSPGPMASAMSSRSRPAGHFGVFPVNAMAGTGGSDGGVQLADKLKIIKTDNFDPDAYVQSKCRAMDEKKMVVFVMQQAVWNVDTNNEAVQGFRRSLHDEEQGNCWRGRATGKTTYKVQAAVRYCVLMLGVKMVATLRFLSFKKKHRGREVTVIDCTSPPAACGSPLAAAAVCSLQSLGAASPTKSELAEIVPQEKSPKGNASFFSFHSTNAAESKVFYLKMKGDYHRKDAAGSTMNSYKVAQVSSDCSPLLEAGQAESLGTELLEMVPSREEEIKLKEYREDAVSTFVVDDYVRLEFKGSTFSGSWKSFSSPKISSTFLVVIAIVSNEIVIHVWMMKTATRCEVHQYYSSY